jgi:hypothetical protein
MIKRISLLLVYFLFTTSLIMGVGGAGHGISAPGTVFFSWAYLLLRLSPESLNKGGYFTLASYLMYLVSFFLLSGFLSRQGKKYSFIAPAGIYLLGSVISSFIHRGFKQEPILLYLACFFFSVLLVVIYIAIDWRLATKVSNQ